MSYPRKYPTGTGDGKLEEIDWDTMVDRVNGVTLTGVRSYDYTFMIRNNGGEYEAIDSAHNLVYGGTGDAGGVDGADAAAVAQAAIDALDPGDSIFVMPGDDYTLSSDGLDLDVAYMTLYGGGMGSKITQADGANINIMLDVSAVGITIDNLYLEGNYANNVNTVGIKLSHANADYFTLRNSWVRHFPSVLVWLSTNNNIFNIHNNFLTEVSNNAAILLSGSADGWVHHNSIGGCANTATGILQVSTATYTNIDHNKLFGSSTNYMYLDTIAFCNINHNIIGGAAPTGTGDLLDVICTHADYGKYNVIADNILYGSADNRDGIRLTGAEVKYNTICGNIISNIDDVAINSFYQSDYNYIHDNYFYNCTTPIVTYSWNSIWKNNGSAKYGVVAQPFHTASNAIAPRFANAAVPAASTDYTVKNMDIIIYSTNSGNNNCAIVIDNEDGTPVSPSLSTLDGMYVPVGYTINWGAYTGAAPTVTISFL